MRRRQLLVVGALTGTLLGIAGLTLLWVQPARMQGRLSGPGREMLARIADAVLDEALPVGAEPRAAAIALHLTRLEDTVAGMPPAMQDEVDQLFTILATAAGRAGLFGLVTPWTRATRAEVQQALQTLRTSSLALRQQTFHALRDLTNAAYFADKDAAQWLGYPGPRVL
jgi:hypothetical protein